MNSIPVLLCTYFYILVCLGHPADLPKRGKFDTLAVIGNSLSDNGISHNDPYGFKRYSSGNIWNEYLAKKLGLQLKNYAFGGARSDYDNYNFHGWSGNLWQVDKLINDSGGSILNGTLIGYEAGGINDLFDDPTVPVPEVIVSNNIIGIRRLLLAGANNIFVLNIADVTEMPAIRDSKNAEAFDSVIRKINTLLSEELGKICKDLSPEKTIAIIDLYSIVGEMSEQFLMEPYVRHQGIKFGDQKQYAFIKDGIHLSDTANYYLFQKVYNQVKGSFF